LLSCKEYFGVGIDGDCLHGRGPRSAKLLVVWDVNDERCHQHSYSADSNMSDRGSYNHDRHPRLTYADEMVIYPVSFRSFPEIKKCVAQHIAFFDLGKHTWIDLFMSSVLNDAYSDSQRVKRRRPVVVTPSRPKRFSLPFQSLSHNFVVLDMYGRALLLVVVPIF